MTWGFIGAAAIGTAGGLIAGGGSQGEVGQTDPTVVRQPQYSFTEPRLKLTSDLVSDYQSQQRNFFNTGELPPWLAKSTSSLRNEQVKGLNRTFFGESGSTTGAFDQARSVGAATGVGPKATQAGVFRTQQQYINQSQEIENYMTQIASQYMNNFAPSQISNQIPRGPETTVLPGTGYNVPPSNPIGDSINSIASSLPWLTGGQNQQPVSDGTITGGVGGTNTGQQTVGGQTFPTWSPYAG